MFKSKGLLATLIMVLAIALSACSSSGSSKVAEGSKTMLSHLTEMKQDVEKNDVTKAKTHFDQAHQAWEKFEDDVKAKDKALYDKIEEPLGVLKGGVKADKLDQKVLLDQIKALEGLLNPLTK